MRFSIFVVLSTPLLAGGAFAVPSQQQDQHQAPVASKVKHFSDVLKHIQGLHVTKREAKEDHIATPKPTSAFGTKSEAKPTGTAVSEFISRVLKEAEAHRSGSHTVKPAIKPTHPTEPVKPEHTKHAEPKHKNSDADAEKPTTPIKTAEKSTGKGFFRRALSLFLRDDQVQLLQLVNSYAQTLYKMLDTRNYQLIMAYGNALAPVENHAMCLSVILRWILKHPDQLYDNFFLVQANKQMNDLVNGYIKAHPGYSYQRIENIVKAYSDLLMPVKVEGGLQLINVINKFHQFELAQAKSKQQMTLTKVFQYLGLQ
jgi:hypothetical protein